MRIREWVVLGLIGLLPVMAMAQQAKVIGPDGWISEPGPLKFKNKAQLREGNYPVGSSVGEFAGINFLQDGDLDVSGSLFSGQTSTLKTKGGNIGGAVGVRYFYTWQSFSEFGTLQPTSVSGDFRVMPSLGAEFFYTAFGYKANETFSGTDVSFKADVDAYVFMVDPVLRFQVGRWRPYIGGGVGGAYMMGGNASVSASGVGTAGLLGDGDCFVFAAQAIAGTEVFIAPTWSLSFDYKYLALIDPKMDSPNNSINYKMDALTNHIFTIGANFYF